MGDGGRWSRAWHRWMADVTSLLATALLVLLGAQAGRAEGAGRLVLMVGAAVSAVAAAGVKVAQDRHRQSEESRGRELRAQDVAVLASVVKPCVEHLARMASAPVGDPTRDAEYAALLTRVVDAAATWTGGPLAVRAVFFRRVDHEQTRALVAAEYSGDPRPSGRTLRDDPSDPAGQGAWRALEKGEVVTWPDVDREAPPGWNPSTRSRPYRTFTMAPVLGPDRQVYGMLNVDALTPRALGPMEEGRLTALAALLAAAIHLLDGLPGVD